MTQSCCIAARRSTAKCRYKLLGRGSHFTAGVFIYFIRGDRRCFLSGRLERLWSRSWTETWWYVAAKRRRTCNATTSERGNSRIIRNGRILRRHVLVVHWRLPTLLKTHFRHSCGRHWWQRIEACVVIRLRPPEVVCNLLHLCSPARRYNNVTCSSLWVHTHVAVGGIVTYTWRSHWWHTVMSGWRWWHTHARSWNVHGWTHDIGCSSDGHSTRARKEG